MTPLHDILYYCSICLHFSNLGFEGYIDQLNSNCRPCLNNLVKEPEIRRNLHFPEKFSQEGQVFFDYHLLPFLRKTIEEKIGYAYEMTDPELPSPFSKLEDQDLINFRKEFSDNLRELYVYEKDVKDIFERQKSEILQKIDQKTEDIMKETMAKLQDKDFCLGERDEKMNRLAEDVRFKKREAKNSVEDLAKSEMMNIILPYSRIIEHIYNRIELFRSKDDKKPGQKILLYLVSDSLEIFKLNIALGKMSIESPRFQEAFQKFNVTLEKFSKELLQLQQNLYLDCMRYKEL